LTDTLMVAGVVPLVGVAVSHVADVVTLKLRACPLLVTDTFCAGGAEPPACAVKVRLVGLTVSPPPVSAHTELGERDKEKINNGIAKRINPAENSLFGYFFFMSFLLEPLR
jgi:hypothetical protein